MDSPLVVNFFAGPGAGKSTTAAAVFALLKMQGVPAELVTEYAKDLTWDEAYKTRRLHLHVFGEQYRRMARLVDQGVEVIVTDSPLLMAAVYTPRPEVDVFGPNVNHSAYRQLVHETFDRFDNRNYFVVRSHPDSAHQRIGRTQTVEQSREVDARIEHYLISNGFHYTSVEGGAGGANLVATQITDELGQALRHAIRMGA